MANHKSVIKRIRQNNKRNIKNRTRTHRVKTFLTKFEDTISSGVKDDIIAGLKIVQSELMIAVNKGAFAKKTASRSFSKLVKRVKTIVGG